MSCTKTAFLGLFRSASSLGIGPWTSSTTVPRRSLGFNSNPIRAFTSFESGTKKMGETKPKLRTTMYFCFAPWPRLQSSWWKCHSYIISLTLATSEADMFGVDCTCVCGACAGDGTSAHSPSPYRCSCTLTSASVATPCCWSRSPAGCPCSPPPVFAVPPSTDSQTPPVHTCCYRHIYMRKTVYEIWFSFAVVKTPQLKIMKLLLTYIICRHWVCKY